MVHTGYYTCIPNDSRLWKGTWYGRSGIVHCENRKPNY